MIGAMEDMGNLEVCIRMGIFLVIFCTVVWWCNRKPKPRKNKKILKLSHDARKMFLSEMAKDYSAESNKPLLVPANEREYWLFTAWYQKLKDFLEV